MLIEARLRVLYNFEYSSKKSGLKRFENKN